MAQTRQRIDRVTIAGLALVMMPLTTMWHEFGGHAAACAALGGRIAEIGAFYVDCNSTDELRRMAVSCAGVAVNILLGLAAFAAWRRAKGDWPRLVLWLLLMDQAFVASGYFAFSGVIGVGDLATGVHGGLVGIAHPWIVRGVEAAAGIFCYSRMIRFGIRSLGDMLGDSPATAPDRRRICHSFYLTSGVAAVVVGLFNPLGLFILLASAAASTFGGLAGFISIGFDVPHGDNERPFAIDRRRWLVALGALVTIGFAAILGPSIRF